MRSGWKQIEEDDMDGRTPNENGDDPLYWQVLVAHWLVKPLDKTDVLYQRCLTIEQDKAKKIAMALDLI